MIDWNAIATPPPLEPGYTRVFNECFQCGERPVKRVFIERDVCWYYLCPNKHIYAPQTDTPDGRFLIVETEAVDA